MRISRRQLLILFLVALLLCDKAWSQTGQIKGSVIDTTENKKLPYAIIALIDMSDSTLHRSIRSGEGGFFFLDKIPLGRYTVMISYPKMADYLKEFSITDTSTIDLSSIPMTPQSVLLQEVIVNSGRPVRMRGDTLEYTADSFATRPNANVEELLKRLPGIYMERGGKIYAQGKVVERLLVDGDEFFSDDPKLAAEYLRADAIDKVQVYDQKSDQAILTGIDDGHRTKTINLKLKENKKNGAFGKVSSGSDLDKIYRHELMAAYFSGGRKVSVFGLATRSSREHSRMTDLNNYVSYDHESFDDRMSSMMSIMQHREYNEVDGAGLPTVLSGGAHYSDKWDNARRRILANYRIEDSRSPSWFNSTGQSINADGSSFFSRNNTNTVTHGYSQTANANFTNAIDSFSTIKLSLSGARSTGGSENFSGSSSANEKGFLVNENSTIVGTQGQSETFGVNGSYQKTFRKQGRSFLLATQYNQGKWTEENLNTSRTRFYDPASGIYLKTDTLDQLQESRNPWHSIAGKMVYADKLSKGLTISGEYGFKRTESASIFQTNDRKAIAGQKIDSLSNNYDFAANTHIGAVSMGYARKKLNLTVGSKVYISRFIQTDNDAGTVIRRNFINWAPNFTGSWRGKESMNLNFTYNGETNQPGVAELQPLRRTNNNLYVQLGNPDLKPSFSHRVSLFVSKFNMRNMSNWNAGLNASYTQQAITSQTTVDAQARTVSQYINLNSLPGFGASFGYSFQIKSLNLRSSINSYINHGANYSIQNGERIKNSSTSQSVSVNFQHDWKDVMSTFYTASLNMSVARSSVKGTQSNSNLSHIHSLRNNIFLPGKIEINSTCRFMFQPSTASFSSFNNTVWDLGVTKKLLSNESLKIKMEVSDLLNKRTGYGRSAGGTSIYEYDRFVVKRYVLLTASWNFSKNF